MVRLLLENGAGSDAKDSIPSDLSLALLKRHDQIAELLRGWVSEGDSLENI